MFFFGGYSSILPYILYLSVVWVCILVGVKGDIWKLFKSADTSEQVFISNNSGQHYKDAFIISANDESLPYSKTNLKNNYTLPNNFSFGNEDQPLFWILIGSDWPNTSQISLISQRGPPISLL